MFLLILLLKNAKFWSNCDSSNTFINEWVSDSNGLIEVFQATLQTIQYWLKFLNYYLLINTITLHQPDRDL